MLVHEPCGGTVNKEKLDKYEGLFCTKCNHLVHAKHVVCTHENSAPLSSNDGYKCSDCGTEQV